MIYPEFLKKDSVVGICAPSAGVGHKIDSFEASLTVLKDQGWKVWETEHVRADDLRGGNATERAQELMGLFAHPAVDAVFAASGGDFLSEILPYIQWDVLKENPKWLMGASDPTGILFPLTTMCDVATIYGSNAGSFDMLTADEKHPEGTLPGYLCNTLSLLKGEYPVQHSFPKHLGLDPYLARDGGPVEFDVESVNRAGFPSLHTKGRCIGGCIDVLKDLMGTAYDAGADFVRRYEDDGIIWYFDNFALSSAVLYRTLLQMRYAGWISPQSTKAVLVGRTLFETVESDMSYDEAVRLALPDIPVLWETDIGHTIPHFTMINGAMLDLDYDGTNVSLTFTPE